MMSETDKTNVAVRPGSSVAAALRLELSEALESVTFVGDT